MTGNAPAVITDALRAEVLKLGSATLYEASRQECILPVALRPTWPGAQVAGAALPVRTAVLAAARARARKEAGYLARLRAGELTTRIYGFSRTAGED